MSDVLVFPHQAFLSLGSNLGDKAENLKRAREKLFLKGTPSYKKLPCCITRNRWIMKTRIGFSIRSCR